MNNGYSDALFNLALENKNIDKIFNSFESFMSLLKDEDIKNYLFSLNISSEEKKKIIEQIKDNYNEDFIYFLYVVLDREDFNNIFDIYDDFKQAYYEYAHIKEVIIVENNKLEEEKLNELYKILDKKYPEYEIKIVEEVENSSAACFEVYIDGKKYGTNLLSELNKLKSKI